MPLLSVIMTVYNGEGFLQETLDAVFAQTFEDFELVVVNNGSTDGTRQILKATSDPRLRIIEAPQHGSFGEGIRLAYGHASGEFIAVQDADDVSTSTRFESQVRILREDPSVGLVCGQFMLIDELGNELGVSRPPEDMGSIVDALQQGSPFAHSTYMYRRTAAESVGGYPPEYSYGPDFGLMVRLIKSGWSIAVVPDVVLRLRQHAGQASNVASLSLTRARDAYGLYREAATLPNVSLPAKRAGKRNLVKRSVQYALALLSAGQFVTGAGQMLVGFAMHPLYCLAYLGGRLLRWIGLVRA